MIPNSPVWSTYHAPNDYPRPDIGIPPAVPAPVQAVSPGPFGIGDSRGKTDARYWVVSQSNGKVILQYSQR